LSLLGRDPLQQFRCHGAECALYGMAELFSGRTFRYRGSA